MQLNSVVRLREPMAYRTTRHSSQDSGVAFAPAGTLCEVVAEDEPTGWILSFEPVEGGAPHEIHNVVDVQVEPA